MARYVDIDKFKKWTTVNIDFYCDKDCIDEGIICDECYYEHGGAEDVVPVVHAEWIKKKSMIYCSNCASGWEAGYINDFKYCPNCGARMIRGE